MNNNSKFIDPVKLQEITKFSVTKGNDIEMRSSKDGIKVYEVSKKLIGILPK